MKDERTEGEIQKATANVLRAMGCAVWSLSQYRPSGQSEGLPDLFVTGRGACIWIEMKSARGKQSPAQEAFQQAVEANGGTYAVIRHESEAVALIERAAMRRSA